MTPVFTALRLHRFLRLNWLLVGIGTFAWIAVKSSAQGSEAPGRYYAQRWLVDDGLPHNVVSRLVQDARGFLWVATGGGLARFDGREFKEYPLPGAATAVNLTVRDLAVEDERTLVLLPSTGGILRLRDGIFSPHPASAALVGRQLFNVLVEPGGVLWVAADGDLLRINESEIETFGVAQGFDRRGHRPSLAVDREKRVWLAAGDLLARYDRGKLVRFPQPLGSSVNIASSHFGGMWVATSPTLFRMEGDRLVTMVSGAAWTEDRAALQEMIEDRRGVLWIASRRFGVSRFENGKIVRTPTSHDQAVSLLEDSEENLWVTSLGGGIERLRPQTFVLFDAATGLTDDISTAVASDAAGTIWAANRRGGLARIAQGRAEMIGLDPSGSFYVSTVCPDREEAIWIGAVNALYRIGTQPGAKLELVSAELRDAHVLFCASNGDLWVGSGEDRIGYFRRGVYHPIANPGEGDRRIKAIVEDSSGRIWLATGEREFLEWKGERLETRIPRGQMMGGLIYAMHADAQGRVWIATSAGLVLWRDGRQQLFTTAQGLPDDLLAQVLVDDRGRLWCGSRRGVFSVATDDLLAVADGRATHVNAITLGPDEGLRGATGLNGFQPGAWKARDGRLWFTTYEGIFGIDPAASWPVRVPPRVYLDAVRVDQQDVGTPAALRLQPHDHQLEFHFVALNYAAPQKVRLRHRLDGYDFDWIETGSERRATYSRLPPGHYVLRVSASNENGIWNEAGASLALTVLPAWWQTWWFRGLGIVVCVGLIGSVARYWSHRRLRLHLQELEREHALEKERARIARDLHDDLGGSLTQIGLLADRLKRQGTDEKLSPALGQLAWRTRRLAGDLESIVWTVSPKNDTLDRLAAFIVQYVSGFFRDTQLEGIVRGEEGIPAVPIAPEVQHHLLAVLKEALNNVLKHSRATVVTVTLAVENREFVICIADDGIGFDPSAAEHSERNGLNNMRSRVADLGGRLEIASAAGRGTQIGLRQPLPAFTRPVVGQPEARR